MKKAIFFFCIICLLYNSTVLSQYKNFDKPQDNYEIKIGGEVNRSVPSLGIGRNFYFTKYISLSPELLVVGTPILGGTFRVNIPITNSLKLSPQAGFGFTPVGFLFSTVGIIGMNFLYKLSNQVNIFIEPRIYYYGEKIISLGSGFFGINDLDKTKPFIITLGVGL